jgi:cytidylate kinase
MAVITMSRAAGSGGDEVARMVAEKLGYAFVDKHFIERVLGQYGFIEFDQAYDSLPTFWDKFDAQKEKRRVEMTRLLNQAIRALAKRGNVVILGRSGYIVLDGLADVLKVRVQAPRGVRVGRLAAQRGLSTEQAVAEVDQTDKVRSNFVRKYYETDWQDADRFDLVINSGKIAPDLATNWIVAAANGLSEAEQGGLPAVKFLNVDLVMVSAVNDELAKQSS